MHVKQITYQAMLVWIIFQIAMLLFLGLLILLGLFNGHHSSPVEQEAVSEVWDPECNFCGSGLVF